jgi:hypothetical protein
MAIGWQDGHLLMTGVSMLVQKCVVLPVLAMVGEREGEQITSAMEGPVAQEAIHKNISK